MKARITKTSAVVFFIFLLLSMSCSKTDDNLPTEPVPINLTQQQVSLIQSGNSFAFDIFSQVMKNAGENENVMISPMSISYALSMTLNGASGTTLTAMMEALRQNGITVDEINNSYKSLTEDLLSVDKRVLITIANSVWTEKDFTVKQAFIDILTNYYKAEAKSFDINDSSAPDKINAWIENNTNGLIKKMIDKLEDNDVMLLINAIYFKGKWKSQFDKSKTADMPFYKTGSSQVDVPMMKQETEYSVYQGNGFVLAEFPYGQGNFVMDVILPDAHNGLNNIMSSVTGAGFTSWISQMTSIKTDVSFPRFKYGFKKKLKDVLSDMGMGIAFTDAADFSNISEQYDLLLNEVTHQSFIETNEEGTEAAAATVVEVGVTSMPVSPMVFKMDHPFMYIIRETTTNSIIFMGRVADPSIN
jgi:serine protease inhibitor